MQDNVIYGTFGAGSDRRTEQMVRQVARLRQIETAARRRGVGKKGYVFSKPSDRIRAARAVGLIVRCARGGGFSVGQIRDEMAKRAGTARIDRYMLSPEADEAEARRRSKKLMGQVRGYLGVAEAVARLTKQDADALKIDVLAETSLWSQSASSSEDDDPRAEHLALELAEMCAAVARRLDLRGIFDRARRVPGTWDVISEKLCSMNVRIGEGGRLDWHPTPEWHGGTESPCLDAGGYLDSCTYWREAPLLPSLPLVRCVHALFFTSFRVERQGRASPLGVKELGDDDFDADVKAGWLELSREIRLAIGPTTSLNEIGPMFETRAYVRAAFLEPDPMTVDVLPNCTLKPQYDPWAHVLHAGFQIHSDSQWRRIVTVDRIDEAEGRLFVPDADPLAWRINPLDPKSPVMEHWYFSWAAVNDATVSHWFDRASGTNNAIAIRYDGTRRGQPIHYARGLIAHEIESDLVNGGLETALEQAIERARHALSKRESGWRSEAQATHERRMAYWQGSADEGEHDRAE